MNQKSIKNSFIAKNIFFDSEPFSKTKAIFEQFEQCKTVVITDFQVEKLVYPTIRHLLPKTHYLLILENGEANKNINAITKIYDFLLSVNADRETLIIGLGGGVIGDLAGFASSTFMRGIPFIQMPTSLLAQVDASVGGKTGFDFNGIKNSIGSFYNANYVIIIPALLQTLPQQHLANGFAEMIKHDWLQNSEKWLKSLVQNLTKIPSEELITASVAFKFNIVEADFKETGLRKILNAGHTVGHAIEAWSLSCHSKPLLHGEAIVWGLVCECWISCAMQQKPFSNAYHWLDFAIKNYPEPPTWPKAIDLLPFLKADKKNQKDLIHFVAICEPGKFIDSASLSIDQLQASLDWIQSSKKTIVKPTNFLEGEIELPFSKSVLNRALILSELTKTKLQLPKNVRLPNDVIVLQNAIKLQKGNINLQDAGTAFRFFTALASFSEGDKLLFGTNRMSNRPIMPLVDALLQLGAKISYQHEPGFPPLEIKGSSILANKVTIDGSLSSQFVSAILLISPLCKNGLTISWTGNLVSRPYINLTIGILEKFGIKVVEANNYFFIKPIEASEVEDAEILEYDWSAAAFWIAACIIAPKANILLKGLKSSDLQGDAKVLPWLKQYGLKAKFSPKGLLLQGFIPTKYTDLEFDAGLYPDWVPALAVVLPLKGYNVKFLNIDNLRIKESNRVEAISQNLQKLGIKSEERTNEMLVFSFEKTSVSKETVNIECFNDHRIAMAFALASLAGFCLKFDNSAVVGKSYPNFWSDFRSLSKVD